MTDAPTQTIPVPVGDALHAQLADETKPTLKTVGVWMVTALSDANAHEGQWLYGWRRDPDNFRFACYQRTQQRSQKP